MHRWRMYAAGLLVAVLMTAEAVVLSARGSKSESAATQASATDSPAQAGQQKKIAYWWDPMLGPSSISDHPGKSAMGMDLVPVFESDVSAGPSVRIDPTVVQNMGVVTAPVVRGSLTRTVRAVGTFQVPEPAAHDVTLKIGGYVEKLYADTNGMSVRKGEALFELYSPDLQVAEEELIAAERNLKGLDAGAPTATGADAQDLVDSARRKLQLWDVADRDIDAIASDTQCPGPSRSAVRWTGTLLTRRSSMARPFRRG